MAYVSVIRPLADRLRDARRDHAVCLRLAASYRLRLLKGEPELRERHTAIVAQARRIRLRFVGAGL